MSYGVKSLRWIWISHSPPTLPHSHGLKSIRSNQTTHVHFHMEWLDNILLIYLL